MSALGKLVRDYLVAQTGFAATFPGGLNPDSNPVDYALPYAVYQGISRNRERLLTGSIWVTTERIQISVAAMTRAQAQTGAQWIADKLALVPALQTIGTTKVYYLKVEDESAQAEILGDGSDEAVRTVEIDILGAYLES
jgi:thymidylate kinase